MFAKHTQKVSGNTQVLPPHKTVMSECYYDYEFSREVICFPLHMCPSDHKSEGKFGSKGCGFYGFVQLYSPTKLSVVCKLSWC